MLIPGLIGVALISSLFYQGFEVEFFVLSEFLLLAWLLSIVWRGFDEGFVIPRQPLVLLISLFWAWLALTPLWSPVPYLSVFNVWWLGTLPLVFWLTTLTPDRERLILTLSPIILLIGYGLAIYALIQFFILQERPRSVFININLHAALLNLIAIPLVAHLFRSSLGAGVRAINNRLLWLGLFLLVFAVALTNSRGATLSLVISLVILSVMLFRQVPRKTIGALFITVAIAFALAYVSWGQEIGSRIASLADPITADPARLRIWAAGWEMVQLSPLLGSGLGSFTFLYPRFRHPLDDTTGYFVHNDYLQLWIEGGLPAFLLLVTLLIVVLAKFIHAMKNDRIPSTVRIELSGWFFALFAIALHSLVTFNFYVLTTLIIAGLMLARMSQLFDQYTDVKVWQFRPGRFLGKTSYRIIIVLLILLPVTYLASITLAIFETDRGLELAKKGLLDKADRSFARAARVYPYADNILISHADLYRHVIALLPKNAREERKIMFNKAHGLLTRAEKLNPLRPLNFLVRGQLYQQNPALSGPDWRAKASKAYTHALALNPRYYRARMAYARMLLKTGERKAAREILEAGLIYTYYDNEYIAPYYALTAKIRWKMGDKTGARELQERVKSAMAVSGWEWVPRPEAEQGITVPKKPRLKPSR